MPDAVSVTLFVEDRAHEEFLKPLVERIAQEAGRTLAIRSYSARGGHPRALDELQTFQTLVERGVLGLSEPDVLVVGSTRTAALGIRSVDGYSKDWLPGFAPRRPSRAPTLTSSAGSWQIQRRSSKHWAGDRGSAGGSDRVPDHGVSQAVRISCDREADALDIRLLEGKFEWNVRLTDDVALDLAAGERLVGIEVLGPSRLLEKPDAPAVDLKDLQPPAVPG